MSGDEYTQAEREEIITLARGLVKALGSRKAHLLINAIISVLGSESSHPQKIGEDPFDQEVKRQIEVDRQRSNLK